MPSYPQVRFSFTIAANWRGWGAVIADPWRHELVDVDCAVGDGRCRGTGVPWGVGRDEAEGARRPACEMAGAVRDSARRACSRRRPGERRDGGRRIMRSLATSDFANDKDRALADGFLVGTTVEDKDADPGPERADLDEAKEAWDDEDTSN